MSSRRDALVVHLSHLGLARNEALAYLTLLEDDEAEGLTGYEVAARSGIPRSAVYAVIRKLENQGAAFQNGDNPARFVATGPEQWLDSVKRETLSRVEETREALEALPKRVRPEPVWILRRYHEVIERIDRMVRSAEHSVYASLWPREVEALMPAFESIAGRELHRVLHSPKRLRVQPSGFSCWIDHVGGDEAKSTWSHKALVVIDRREALIGGTEPDADNHAVWTSNPSLVDTATNHIILDITLMSRATGRECLDDVAPMMRPHLDKVS